MNKKGIALIMAVGVLALLAIIATSFALSMRLEYYAAMNYYNGVKARYFAESALQRAIAELRLHVKSSAFDDLVSADEVWSTTGYNNDGSITANIITAKGTSRTFVSASDKGVVDEQRKININSITNAALLDNLITILKDKVSGAVYGSLSSSDSAGIFNNGPHASLPMAVYNSLNEIIIRTAGSVAPITKAKVDLLAGFMTTVSYEDCNCSNRSPININTADQAVIAAVITGIAHTNTGPGDPMPTVSAITTDTAWDVADHIINGTKKRPFKGWNEFDQTIDDIVGTHISANQAALIKYNCNPNRPKPSTHTTEFCFNSGGYYTVTATGAVTGAPGIPVASRILSAIVKIYGIYTHTTAADFRGEDVDYDNVKDAGEDINGNGILDTPTYARVTWLDSCPTESTDLFGKYSITSTAKTIPGSLKLGYWDDFEIATEPYTRQQVIAVNGEYNFEDFDTSDGDMELCRKWGVGNEAYGKYCLSDISKWTWGNFSLRVHEKDAGAEISPTKDQAYILFRGIVVYAPVLLLSNTGNLSWDSFGVPVFAWWVNTIDPGNPNQRVPGSYEMVTDASGQNVRRILYATMARAGSPLIGDPWYPAPLIEKAIYTPDGKPHLRLWPNSNALYSENWNTTNPQPAEYYAAHFLSGPGASDSKTFNLQVRDRTVVANVYVSPADPGLPTPLTNSAVTSNITNLTGLIGLYGQGMYPAWDDLRIISQDGNYTSAFIDPPNITNAAWGTITGTITYPASAIANDAKGDIKIRTSVDEFSAERSLNDSDPSLALNGVLAGTLRYKAFLTQNATDSKMHETPVLEDITITYLPKVEIRSYSLSQ